MRDVGLVCPITRRAVKAIAIEFESDPLEGIEAASCPACARSHLVMRDTGLLLYPEPRLSAPQAPPKAAIRRGGVFLVAQSSGREAQGRDVPGRKASGML